MSAITVNTFPSMNAFTSARGWFMAIIVLLHAGFVWMLSAGLTYEKLFKPDRGELVDLGMLDRPRPKPVEPIVDRTSIRRDDNILTPTPTPVYDDTPVRDDVIIVPNSPPPIGDVIDKGDVVRVPVEIAPEIDARRGLSEPLYPAADIRQGNTGTVVLSVYVLENGRVGEVKLRQSSGHTRLDQSAIREARQWRLKPGMRDGAPVAMWKDIPITFRLTEAVKF